MSADHEAPGVQPGRRSLLAMLGSFAAVALLVVCASLVAATRISKAPSTPPVSPEEVQPEVAAFLGPLATGSPFGSWHIAKIEPVRHGGLALELEGESGERLVVDVRARSPAAPAGIAETSRLAIYARTKESGAETPEAVEQACAALAAALEAREDAGHDPPPLEGLAPAP